MIINKKLDHKFIWKNSFKGYSIAIVAFVVMSILPLIFTVNKSGMYEDNSFFSIVGTLVLSLTPFVMGILIGNKLKFKMFESISLGIAGMIVARSMLAPVYVASTGKIDFAGMTFKLMPILTNDTFTLERAVGNYFTSFITIVLFAYLLSFVKFNSKYDYLFMPILGGLIGIIAIPLISVLVGLFMSFMQWLAGLNIKSDVYAVQIGLSTIFALILSIFMLSPATGILFLLPWVTSGGVSQSVALMIATITSSFSVMFGYLSLRATKKWSNFFQVVLISPLLLMDKIFKKPILLVAPIILATIFAPISIAIFEIKAIKTAAWFSSGGGLTSIDQTIYGTTFLIPQLKMIFSNISHWLPATLALGHVLLLQIGLPLLFIWISTRSQFAENEWNADVLSIEPYSEDESSLNEENKFKFKEFVSSIKMKINNQKQNRETIKKAKEENKEDE